MRLLALLASVPFSWMLACSTVAARPATDTPQARAAAAVGHSAGDVAGTATPGLTGADLAAMRAEGPPALARLLAQYDALTDPAARRALAGTIDKVAGQRYATLSRLYWYEDLAEAKAVARATGKPILSLRMLGRLDEDLSCANSRFFRTTLYPDAAVAALLRDKFVLHWSSERDVPRVTVDFGDGRKLESTITGNSAHYILDADGRPLDVLPGLYAPQVFVRELEVDVRLHASLRGLDDRRRTQQLVAHHQAALQVSSEAWDKLPAIPTIVGARALLTEATVTGAAAAAQRATMSKAYVEVPILQTVDLGADPGKLPDNTELWAEIGQRLLNVGAPPDPTAAAALAGNPFGYAMVEGAAVAGAAPVRPAARPTGATRPILDPQARALVDAMLGETRDGTSLDLAARNRVIERLEQTIVADTALNEVRLRPQIRAELVWLLAQDKANFEQLNTFIYTNVFHTPAEDAWMGLLPRDSFTGLPAGAVITKS